ncbi:MAG: hypothetical protein ACXVB9_12965, partial [Bdellovibrionota bacterium]
MMERQGRSGVYTGKGDRVHLGPPALAPSGSLRECKNSILLFLSNRLHLRWPLLCYRYPNP